MPSTTAVLLLSTLMGVVLFQTARGKVTESINGMHDKSNFELLARFCFVNNGVVEFTIKYPRSQGIIKLLYLYDNPDTWAALRGKQSTCDERYAAAADAGNSVSLSPDYYFACGIDISGDNIICNHKVTIETSWHRWWFFVVANCESNNSVDLSYYKFHMQNSPGIFTLEFSADEFGILQTDYAFMSVYIFIVVVVFINARRLKDKSRLHTSYYIFIASVVMTFFALIFDVAHYASYANDGIGVTGLKSFGEVTQFGSFLSFALLLLCLAKGWTVTRGRLREVTMCRLLSLLVLFLILYMAMFIWYTTSDLADHVLYIYASPPGYGLVAMYILTFLWFCYAIFFSIKNFEERRSFFQVFFLVYLPWFLGIPVSILVLGQAVEDYQRRKIVNGIQWGILAYGHSLFMVLTWPSAFKALFPYHVRTDQIDVMIDPADRVMLGAYNVTADTAEGESVQHAYHAAIKRSTTQSKFVVVNLSAPDGDAGETQEAVRRQRRLFTNSTPHHDDMLDDGDLGIGSSISSDDKSSCRNLLQVDETSGDDTKTAPGSVTSLEVKTATKGHGGGRKILSVSQHISYASLGSSGRGSLSEENRSLKSAFVRSTGDAGESIFSPRHSEK